jgi:hypothetical protein
MKKRGRNEKNEKVEKTQKLDELPTWQIQDEVERDWDKNFYAPYEKTTASQTGEKAIFVEDTHNYYLQGIHPETGKLVKSIDPILLSASGLLNYSKTGKERSGFCMSAIYRENIKQRFPMFLSTYFCVIKKMQEGERHGMEFMKCTLKCEKKRQFVFQALGVMCFDQLYNIFNGHVDKARLTGFFNSYVEREPLFMACQVIVDSTFVVDNGMNSVGTCYQGLITNRAFNEIEKNIFMSSPIEQTAVRDVCLLLSHSKHHLSYHYPSLLHIVQQHEQNTDIFSDITNRAKENGTTLHAYMEELLKFGKSDIVLPDIQDKINIDALMNDYLNPMFNSGKFKFRSDLSEVAIGSLKHKVCGKSDLIIEDLTTKELFIMDFKRADLKELARASYVPIGAIGRKYNFDVPPTKSGDIYKYAFQLGTYRKLHMLHGYKVKPFIFLIGLSPGKIGWTLTRVSLYGSTNKMEPVAKAIRETFLKREKEMTEKFLGQLLV